MAVHLQIVDGRIGVVSLDNVCVFVAAFRIRWNKNEVLRKRHSAAQIAAVLMGSWG